MGLKKKARRSPVPLIIMSYIILSKPGCVFCTKAKEFLGEYDERECTTIEEARTVLTSLGIPKTDFVSTFPQIVYKDDHKNTYVGGYEQLLDYVDEPILRHNPNRYTPFPIVYNDMWDLYKKGVASFWTADEVSLAQDVKYW